VWRESDEKGSYYEEDMPMNRLLKILFLGLLVVSGVIITYEYFAVESPFDPGTTEAPVTTEAPAAEPIHPESETAPLESAPETPDAGVTPVYTYKIINAYPHDPGAFTQGLVFEDGFLYEGTGLYGRSSLRKVELKTGKVLQIRNLSDQYFGEGITIFLDKIIQLTWQSRVGFVYRKENFDVMSQFHYSTEGWGITHDGVHLIMSDGTSTLYFLDPETFEVVNHVDVHDGTTPVTNLNELEYIRGEVYANVWQTDFIVQIDPQTGDVVGWIDLEGLLPPGEHGTRVDVLNGIAYDVKHDRLFVTGKLWPTLFEIELVLQNHDTYLSIVYDKSQCWKSRSKPMLMI
jgi:glutamine cyclotransferase